MTEMSNIPAEIVDDRVEIVINCTEEETINRLNICKNCDSFIIEDYVTKCVSSGCNISLMTTFKFKPCPLNKW